MLLSGLPNDLLKIIGKLSQNRELYKVNKRFREIFTDMFFDRNISIYKIRHIDKEYKKSVKRLTNVSNIIVLIDFTNLDNPKNWLE